MSEFNLRSPRKSSTILLGYALASEADIRTAVDC